MTSRDRILQQIKLNKPAETLLPQTTRFDSLYENTEDKFIETLTAIYTEVIVVKDLAELVRKAGELYASVVNRATTIPALADWADFSLNDPDPHALELIEIAILQAEFGVAENGAVWISDTHLPHRALPFITQNLAFVIPRNAIVNNMHDAYERLHDTTGWGCFISGPSKTADIEQSLVIGAHGARSLVIFLLEDA
ncbi:lactate utilization protein [Dyadobacter chenwenxiniae]|uniref:Lactate utilization protein n=1 Tax=Dyadobacter chenwenxiniae TaxID=2906456 RepID=A0A9X1PLM6_9BACT|nr:LUD domain-containing protein [Dyadobacter chenwenxiniae]MCF0063652.1 lactate utilization protein [Dyadobacter chenwenxiniae]UON83328.1 lactate utilization protein [Dyadobacter chenwenxiniae]